MMKYIRKALQIIKKLNNPYERAKWRYLRQYETLPLDEKCILLESQHGREFNGNIFCLATVLSENEKYKDFSVYVSATAEKLPGFRKKAEQYGLKRVRFVVLSTDAYFRLLSSAKFLINDNTFLPFFLKKSGQVYLNTWHGTPLKTLGRKMNEDFQGIGNAQRNFAIADFILFPNEFTRERILEDYMVSNLSRGSCFYAGYPRNTVFFDQDRAKEIRDAAGAKGKRVYAYMPTFRGTASKGKTDTSDKRLISELRQIDRLLSDEEILYVNLHPVAQSAVTFDDFIHIKPFPKDLETYDFLNIADVLITDYSSVFFDFACTRRKIVLFTYDADEYLATRGLYMGLEDLPFPKVANARELVNELRSAISYDDTAFYEKFCKYDNKDVTESVCDFLLFGNRDKIAEEKITGNGRKNVLIYAGNLALNGITIALRNIMSNIDLNERNYYLTFRPNELVDKGRTLRDFPEGMYYFGMAGGDNFSLTECVKRKLFHKGIIKIPAYIDGTVRHHLKLEQMRLWGADTFDYVIQFNGYVPDMILLFSAFDCPRTIFVHSDMLNEIKTRGNHRLDVLQYAYSHYDRIAVVSEDLKETTAAITGGRHKEIAVVPSYIDADSIADKMVRKMEFDADTAFFPDEESVIKALESTRKKFVNIARFSPEKGQIRLINAFAEFSRNYPETCLFMIGGSAFNDFDEKLKKVILQNGLENRVFLIKKMSNPYTVLKKCDYFVFSSFYEGFGLVLAEADIAGKPVVSTDIIGTRGFLKEYGGVLVENSEKGIAEGLQKLIEGKVPVMNIDYRKYNENAVAQFNKLFE